MTDAAHRAAVEIAKQVFPTCGDGTMSEQAIEDAVCVRRLARIIDDELIKEKPKCPKCGGADGECCVYWHKESGEMTFARRGSWMR